MLDLLDGGRCMSGVDAIEFMERLDDVLDDEVKTDEFCNEFTFAMNRFRYEIRRSVPIVPKKGPGKITYYECGQCGHGVREENRYCGQCGRKIDWASK